MTFCACLVHEVDSLNRQPTSFVLPAEAVDRLRAAAATIIRQSPEFRRLLDDVEASIAPETTGSKREVTP